MLKLHRICWVVILAGCFSSGPRDVQVVVQGDAATQIVSGIEHDDFLVYSISRTQVNEITNVYTDYIRTREFLTEGDYREYQAFLDTVITPELKSYLSRLLPIAVNNIDYTLAEEQYITELNVLQEKVRENDEALAAINEEQLHLDELNRQLNDKLKGIKAKETEAKQRLADIQIDFFTRLSSYNDIWPDYRIPSANLVFDRFRYITASENVCYASFRNYDIVYHKHGLCFVRSLPQRFSDQHPMYEAYKAAFKEYIDVKLFLSANNPMLDGTLEKLKMEVTREVYGERQKLGANGTFDATLKDRKAKLMVTVKRDLYAYETMILNKNRHINALLEGNIGTLREILSDGIDLSNPSSPLYRVAIRTMNAIPSNTLNEQHKAPYSKESMMIIAQVNAENREKFPIFVKPSIIDQKSITDLDTYPVYLNHGNIEHVSQFGIVHTLVFMVGEAFLGWRNTD